MSAPNGAGQAVQKANGEGQVHRTVWRGYGNRPWLSTACGLGVASKVVVDPNEVPEHRACWNCYGRQIRLRRAAAAVEVLRGETR